MRYAIFVNRQGTPTFFASTNTAEEARTIARRCVEHGIPSAWTLAITGPIDTLNHQEWVDCFTA